MTMLKITITVCSLILVCFGLSSCSAKRIIVGTATLGLSEVGPAGYRIDMQKSVEDMQKSVKKYHETADKVQLGDSKEKVLSILPNQSKLGTLAKAPEKFVSGDSVIEIIFFRTGHNPDWRTTDDEFTPYVFIDNKLHAIGWNAVRILDNQKE